MQSSRLPAQSVLRQHTQSHLALAAAQVGTVAARGTSAAPSLEEAPSSLQSLLGLLTVF